MSINSPLARAALLAACAFCSCPALAADVDFEIFHLFSKRAVEGGWAIGSGLILAQDGYFYGTTSFYEGSVFRVAQNGYFEDLFTFTDSEVHGAHPGQLMQTQDGRIYGVAGGGSLYGGVLFEVVDGTVTTFFNFGYATTGVGPTGPLVEGPDGALYGTLQSGGAQQTGSVYRYSPDEGFSTLHSFDANLGGNVEGTSPAALMLSSDGYFYGIAIRGGANNAGTIFRVSPTGAFEVMHTFSGKNREASTDGGYPVGRLVEDDSGVLYGTTSSGGANGTGTVYKLVKPAVAVPPLTSGEGTITLLHSFGAYNATAADGLYPQAGLTLASDGLLYGTTSDGTSKGAGGLFRVSKEGAFEPLYEFSTDSPEGYQPESELLQGPDGSIYGGTGRYYGSVFRLNVGLGTPTPIAPPTVELSITPSTIKTNETAAVEWSSQHGYRFCDLGGMWSGMTQEESPPGGATFDPGAEKLAPGTYSLTVTCHNEGGSTSASASVTVELYHPPVDSDVSHGTNRTGAWDGGGMALLLSLALVRRRRKDRELVVMGGIEPPTSAL
jgi:uncharacterized repeat protein (TIGR03803 family)